METTGNQGSEARPIGAVTPQEIGDVIGAEVSEDSNGADLRYMNVGFVRINFLGRAHAPLATQKVHPNMSLSMGSDNVHYNLHDAEVAIDRDNGRVDFVIQDRPAMVTQTISISRDRVEIAYRPTVNQTSQ